MRRKSFSTYNDFGAVIRKVCSRCSIEKLPREFSPNSTLRSGLESRCKKCNAAQQAKIRAKNRDAFNAAARIYNKIHKEKYPDRVRLQATNSRLKRFGINLDQYQRMLELQAYSCAICGASEQENGKRFSVDHDHDTGRIRGLLCLRCNSGIGMLNDSHAVAERALEYLRGA